MGYKDYHCTSDEHDKEHDKMVLGAMRDWGAIDALVECGDFDTDTRNTMIRNIVSVYDNLENNDVRFSRLYAEGFMVANLPQRYRAFIERELRDLYYY